MYALPTAQDSDVVMGGTSAIPPGAFTLYAGSAARAAAAEHNSSHGKATAHHHDDMDEDMSDDMRIAKKRRASHPRKFSSVVDSADNGYDSMEIDNGLDEFTDLRRSKPPARKGQWAYDATPPLHTLHAMTIVCCSSIVEQHTLAFRLSLFFSSTCTL